MTCVRRVLRYGLNLLTVVGAAFVLLPYFWMVSSSLKTQDEIFRLPIEWVPPQPQWTNYPIALGRFPFGIYFFNSALVALAVMVGNVFFGSLAAYGLAKFPFPLRAFCFRAMLSTLMLPLEILLVPTFLVVRQLGLLDSYGGLVLPLAVDAFGIFLMRQYFLDLPDSLLEAARLDGCSEFGIYWRIVLPNSRPALAALAVLSFRENWDQFLWPLVIVSREALKTFPLGLALFEGSFNASYHEMMAAAVVGMIPMMVLFLVFQRAFVRGLTLTGLKE
jgi:ABC-type glycerol-3-phosphate transport system permease component